MMLTWVVALALVVALVWLLLQGAARRGPRDGPPPGPPSAEEILRQRYARGEIDRETYLKMLDDLQRGSAR